MLLEPFPKQGLMLNTTWEKKKVQFIVTVQEVPTVIRADTKTEGNIEDMKF